MFSSKLASAKTKAARSSDSKHSRRSAQLWQLVHQRGTQSRAPFLPRSVGSQAAFFRPLTLPLSPAEKAPRISQFKRVVGELSDPLEHEADRVADDVMRPPAGSVRIE